MFNDFELRQQIEDIANQFNIFECVECAEAIKRFLIGRNINGKHIELSTGSTEDPFCNIYHDEFRQNISVNGKHEAIAVTINNGEFIFDNLHPEGVFLRREWQKNFYFPGLDMNVDFQIMALSDRVCQCSQ
ncbi:MAG: papain fold toxin domain-containing protein [Leptolyngbyaceae cyanobacterium bins.349]|nr:papain fold toxin domain-containing protein [Leptolyngbyaceae cyanobacterium bins.349]